MSFQKQLFSVGGATGTISESAGNVTLAVTLAENAGGGALAGVATVSGSLSVSFGAKQLIDAGLELAATKFPSVAALIKEAQVLIDAEIAAQA